MNIFNIIYKEGNQANFEINGSWLVEDGFVQFTDKESGMVRLCISTDVVYSIELIKVGD